MARGFMGPILDSMGKGSFFRQVVSSVMVVLGIIGLIVAALGTIWSVISGFEISGLNGIGGIIFGVAWCLAAIGALEILLYRGRKTDQLPDSPYSVLSVFSQILRAVGEVGATYGVLMGIGGGINAWISDVFAPAGYSGFSAGVAVFATSVSYAFISLFVTYFIAECVNLAVNIANDSRRIAMRGSTEHPASDKARIGEREAG